MYDPMQPTTLIIGTNEWWLARLGRRLDDRRARMTQLEDYYAGRQPLAFVSDTFKAAFGDRFRLFSANFMSLVVDTHRQRLQVQGIRIGDHTKGAVDAWDWWQRNRLDAESQTAFTESLVKGIVYILVWPNEKGEPETSIESPLQVVVETAPGQSWKRRAALKRWLGEDGKYHAELYLPEGIYKYISAQSGAGFTLSTWGNVAQWKPEVITGEPWPVKNPLGVIPIVPLINRPRLNGTNPAGLYDVRTSPSGNTQQSSSGAVLPDDGQSEMASVMSNQDAINKLRADIVNASDLAAFRQRWVLNFDVQTDEKTGQLIEPWKSAIDRLWTVPRPDPDDVTAKDFPTEFGEFAATDLAPMIAGIQAEIQQLGAISQTPYHYLLPQSGQPPSGDSLRTAETGLVSKVKDSQLHKGEGLEEVFRLNFAFRGDDRADDMGAEIIWTNPESLAEGVHTDALVKQKATGIPDEVLWEGFGYSEREIARIKTIIKALADADATAAAAAPPPPPPTDTTPAANVPPTLPMTAQPMPNISHK